MRLIDADALKIELAILHGGDYKTIHYLNHARTVDAVPVIRCKDCKWYGRDHDGGCLCENGGGLFDAKPDDFCSRGKKE